MAFGDGGNDFEMLEYVPHSVAMGNAPDFVKAIASYVTDDVDHDGLAAAFRHFGMIGSS
jgi:hydroxymethylpyrimidine pyrophosphatase-like HAD family hydrolase